MKNPTGLRISDDIKQSVLQAAIEDDRSYSAEIRYLVKIGLANREREQRLTSSIQAQELAGFMAGGQVL